MTAAKAQQDWGWGGASASSGAKPVVLSRWQLDLFVKCPRCFWLLKRHGVKQPDSYPLALNIAVDGLLKAEFDACRATGDRTHPLLREHGVPARLFGDLERLRVWRNNFQGLRWSDPATGHTLFGAVDDVLEFPDGALAPLDYKASGAKEAKVYPSYQLQLDVYTFLLQCLGYRTAPQAYLAFYMVVKDAGFEGRLPFRGSLVAVNAQPERVLELFQRAVALAMSESAPPAGTECDVCRWFTEAVPRMSAATPQDPQHA